MKTNIYITSCDETGGIYHYHFSGGSLTFCEKVELDRPMYTVIKDKKAYTLLRQAEKNTGFGGLVSFDTDANGRFINPSRAISTKGAVPCHLCVEGNDIYAVNYLSGNLIRFPDKIVTHTGKGVDKIRQEMPHTHFVAVTPDKKYVLCTDLGLDTVFVYDRDLESVSSAKVSPGSGCRHLVFYKNAVYCVNELSNDVSVFDYGGGKLTLIGSYPAIPGYEGKSKAAAIRIYNDRLYVSHRGADLISCFEIKNDALKHLWDTPCGGISPRDFDIVDGFIICANEGGNVSVLELRQNGARLVNDSVKIPVPLCVTIGERL